MRCHGKLRGRKEIRWLCIDNLIERGMFLNIIGSEMGKGSHDQSATLTLHSVRGHIDNQFVPARKGHEFVAEIPESFHLIPVHTKVKALGQCPNPLSGTNEVCSKDQ